MSVEIRDLDHNGIFNWVDVDPRYITTSTAQDSVIIGKGNAFSVDDIKALRILLEESLDLFKDKSLDLETDIRIKNKIEETLGLLLLFKKDAFIDKRVSELEEAIKNIKSL